MRNNVMDWQKAAKMAKNLNEIDMTITKHDSTKESDIGLEKTFHGTKKMLIGLNVQVVSEIQEHSDVNDNDMRVHIKLSPNMTSAKGMISKSGQILTFSDIYIDMGIDNDDEMNEIEKGILHDGKQFDKFKICKRFQLHVL